MKRARAYKCSQPATHTRDAVWTACLSACFLRGPAAPHHTMLRRAACLWLQEGDDDMPAARKALKKGLKIKSIHLQQDVDTDSTVGEARAAQSSAAPHRAACAAATPHAHAHPHAAEAGLSTTHPPL